MISKSTSVSVKSRFVVIRLAKQHYKPLTILVPSTLKIKKRRQEIQKMLFSDEWNIPRDSLFNTVDIDVWVPRTVWVER